AKIAERHRALCYVSLEEFIVCGVGACQGCAVRTKNGYKRVCKDGPVFDSKEIIW
ncbi:TPA: dihydroorotate dehydrogenase electron transfer subunit, partial [bacterium]|nr:dihydroorotate dehydrogenase electron transfer subunit [bacterium]